MISFDKKVKQIHNIAKGDRIMYTYEAEEGNLGVIDGKSVKAYDIKVCDENGKTVDRICGVTVNRRYAEILAEQFTKYDLSPAHFREAVEDFLIDFCVPRN